MTLVQKSPTHIYMAKEEVISDMQGPCDTGFHIPTKDEWEKVRTDGITMGAWAEASSSTQTLDNFCTYLKIPAMGVVYGWDGDISAVGNDASYAACDGFENSSGSVRYYYISATYYYNSSPPGKIAIYSQTASSMLPIRAFKDTPTVPTSSWTTLYQGSGGAGIFWNSTDGLISISSDGTNWTTIQDKNLGATTVYNYNDTRSQANCGNYYQRGNNHGFPFSGGWTTSTTTVNASAYGPGNYYDSSTFIKTSDSSNYNWDTSKNLNLRGGVTQQSGTVTVDKEITSVRLGETKVRPPALPDYLCFTATVAGRTIRLAKNGSPTAVSLEISTDLTTWSDYTIGDTITFSNVGDKVYFRNKSETTVGFGTSSSNYYQFVMSDNYGGIAASGDINYLLNKNSTDTIPTEYCFYSLFGGQKALETPPKLPATTITANCYDNMFNSCRMLNCLPELPATELKNYCYNGMFYMCTEIQLSATQTGSYQTPYRIPTTGTGNTASYALSNMFSYTGGTLTGTPSINTTYYTANTVV